MPRAFLFALLVVGCHVDLNDPGTDPLPRQLYFPSGIAFDSVAGRQLLYVSNGNADLRYGGGTVQLVDVKRFDCALDRWCETNGCARPAAADDGCDAAAIAQADTDLAFHPDGKNEAECQPDPLDPSVVDCDETPFIVGNATVRVGNFAGSLRVMRLSDTERRLFVGVRGDPSVTWINAHLGNLPVTDDPLPGVLDCFDNPSSLTSRSGYDAQRNLIIHPSGCDESHLLQTYNCDGKPGCTQANPLLPTEPFGMRLDQGKLPDGSDYARLLVSHLSTGQVSLIDATLAPERGKQILDVSAPFFAADNTGRRGAFSLAPMRPHDPASPWYMTSNLQPVIATFRVAQAGVIVPSVSFNIGGAFAIGSDVREIVFEPGGNRAFLTEANPPSALVIDTRITQGRNPGQPLNQLVDIVDVCQTPSHMDARRSWVAGAAGARLATTLYVVCFLSNQLMAVDPDAPQVEDTILVGRGPNDIVFNFPSVGDDPAFAPPEPAHRRAWVTQFSEMTIGEIDLDPGSPTKHRLVARLGKPVPPPAP